MEFNRRFDLKGKRIGTVGDDFDEIYGNDSFQKYFTRVSVLGVIRDGRVITAVETESVVLEMFRGLLACYSYEFNRNAKCRFISQLRGSSMFRLFNNSLFQPFG